MVCKTSWTLVDAFTGSERVRGSPSPANVVRSTVTVRSLAGPGRPAHGDEAVTGSVDSVAAMTGRGGLMCRCPLDVVD